MEHSDAYHQFFEQNPLPMYVFDRETLDFLAVNDAAVRHYGYTRREFLTMKADAIRPPEDVARFKEVLRTAALKGPGIHEAGLWRHRTKDGRMLQVEISHSQIVFQDRPSFLVSVRDVTEQKRAEAAREKAQETSRFTGYAVDHIGIALYVMGPDAKIVYVNQIGYERLGYTLDEMLHMTVPDFDPHFPAEAWPGHWEDVQRRKTFTLRSEHKRKDGRRFPIQVTVNHVVFDGKEFNFAFVHDITDLVKAETQANEWKERTVRSEKLSAVGQLAAGVAHELNNPLGVILGYAEVLSDGLAPGSALAEPLKAIERETQRCRNLVQDLLIFSRQRKPGMAAESLGDVLEGALTLVETQGHVRNVKIERRFQPRLPRIDIDRSQIQQVLINLCTNAFDAMPDGGVVTVGLARAGDFLEIQVRDTGIGIPRENHQKVFEPFFTTKDVGQGTGLGLSLVHEIIKKHRGEIDLQSELGCGTTFTLRLPLAAAKEAGPALTA